MTAKKRTAKIFTLKDSSERSPPNTMKKDSKSPPSIQKKKLIPRQSQ
jgi:hypothetical protein